jgi:hypothetical protein
MKTINQDIKTAIKGVGLHQYQVADQMGIAETTLVRWLRYDLSDEKRTQINDAINELSK